MLTTRGWWFWVMALGLVLLAGLTPSGHLPLILVGLTLLLWGLVEWLLFAVRWHGALAQLVVERELRDERGPVASLWAGRSFEVRVQLRLAGWLRLPYVLVKDQLPFGVELVGGETRWEGELSPRRPIELAYRIRCPGVGLVRFEGIALHTADVQGFFYQRTFHRAVQIYRVLPVLGAVDLGSAVTKRFNLLPPPGIHRHRRPGSGSELLDLRDYLPGDPPRTIAWKVSARRDRLITKEFESDVPVRCTLFVDASNSVRLGPPQQTALTRLVEIAATVARASIGNRDPVGLCLFDEQQVQYLRPARTRRQLTDILNLLADAAGREAVSGEADLDRLLPLGFAFVEEVYPQYLRREVNTFPPWLAWLRPPSIWTIPRPRLGDFLYWLLPVMLLGLLLLGVTCAGWLGSAVGQLLQRIPVGAREIAVQLLLLLGLIHLLLGLRMLSWLFVGRRRAYRWRKQMAAILSVRYGLAPGGLAALLEDDRQLAWYLQRFLAEHRVPRLLPLYDTQGRYLFAAPAKVETLAQALLRAIGKGHDNELFVLFADLLELTDQLGPLLKAVKVALARHHQVLVVCPWPPGLPPPGRERLTIIASDRPGARLSQAASGEPPDWNLFPLMTQRFHEAFVQLRRTFTRLGVPVVCAQGEEPARLIVERLDRMRTVRSGPQPAPKPPA